MVDTDVLLSRLDELGATRAEAKHALSEIAEIVPVLRHEGISKVEIAHRAQISRVTLDKILRGDSHVDALL